MRVTRLPAVDGHAVAVQVFGAPVALIREVGLGRFQRQPCHYPDHWRSDRRWAAAKVGRHETSEEGDGLFRFRQRHAVLSHREATSGSVSQPVTLASKPSKFGDLQIIDPCQ